MEYKKSSTIQGEWIKAGELQNGVFIKLVSEAKPIQGEYGEQNVAQAKIKGFDGVKNVRLNKTTINGLIDAYGEDSANWTDKVLVAYIEKALVGGKRVTILYLVPENWELKENTEGYLEVVNPNNDSTQKAPEDNIPVVNENEEENW